MSLINSIQSELIKTKRSSSFWVSLFGAGMIPLILLLIFLFNAKEFSGRMGTVPWTIHFNLGYQQFSSFLLPMFVILICSQIPQIEYKNNTWKQVFASPQSIGNIFFSKYIAILLMIIFLSVMFNVFMLLTGVIAALVHPELPFLKFSPDWKHLIKLGLKTFVSLLAIISIQYWLSLRFRNFIAAIGIGLALLITSLMLFGFGWQHIYKVPYAYPFLTLVGRPPASNPLFLNHEWNSIGYFIFFSILAFLDMKYRKQRG